MALEDFLAVWGDFALHMLISSRTVAVFPWGTFAVNIIGCLLIGLLVGLESKTQLVTNPAKWLLISGFCGGFTTFSTFSAEGLGLLHQQHYGPFIAYTGGSVIIGLLCTYFGYNLIRWAF